MYYYASKNTERYLKTNKQWVYLFGSCGGYSNFGDVIQLKNAVMFHKKKTGLEPVVVMFLNALDGAQHPARLQQWYDVKHFVFVSKEALDASDAGLYPLESVRAERPMHVYGGGFLNHFWGADMIEVISHLLSDFKITRYLFSGQQIDESVMPRLKKLFKTHPPMIVGLRDTISLAYIQKHIPDVRSVFSFDDVTEVFDLWAKQKPARAARIRKYLPGKSVLWHINMSGYVIKDGSRVRERMLALRERYPRYSLVVAHAYNDQRRELMDSLHSIVELGNHFPYSSYKVINLATYALEAKPHLGKMPNIKAVTSNIKLAVTSSYHTAVLMSFLGIPVFLSAANDFYEQKQKGLGYSGDYDAFINKPNINKKDFHEERDARKIWIRELPRYFSENNTLTNELIDLSNSSGRKPKLTYRHN